ncbi:MAG: thioredoxin family protein [Deltaproteobacteria bacterium]|nr:thioredoxin family protein [Deltaproteobacteria bacterium]
MRRMTRIAAPVLLMMALSSCSGGGDFDVKATIERHGLVLTLAIAYGLGVLTSFTPCVYPLIPVTVSIFGARKTTRSRAFLLSVCYALGIAATYSALGALTAFTGTLFGSFMTNPVVIGAIGVVFGALALSMAGLFEIGLPPSLQARLSSVGGAGFLGAFSMGLVAGFIAAPCTGPILVGILAFVSTSGSLAAGLAILFSYALGIGLLFIVIGTFSGLAASLPKSGRWMEVVRSVFAAVLFGAALYFVRNILPVVGALFERPPWSYLAAAAIFVIGAAAGGLHLDVTVAPWTKKLRKAVASFLVGAGLFGLVAAATGGKLPSPEWVGSESEGLAAARQDGKPAILDFYADWCAACKELDHKTWSDARVIEESKRFVMIKIDATSGDDAVTGLQEKYAVPGLPAVIFIEPGGKLRPDLRANGFIPADEMLRRMIIIR